MTSTTLGPDTFPLLGEPFVAEFANTLYKTETETIDFLANRPLFEGWFKHAECTKPFDQPRLSNESLQTIRTLRNAVHMLCTHMVDHTPADTSDAIGVLNRTSQLATKQIELISASGQQLKTHERWYGKAEHVFVATLASEAINFFVSEDCSKLRRCATPICSLLFVRGHHRRNFCTEHCSQRTRQNRYIHSKQAPAE